MLPEMSEEEVDPAKTLGEVIVTVAVAVWGYSSVPGTATVTLTLKDKEPVSCKITVKSAANADLSKLKFQTRTSLMPLLVTSMSRSSFEAIMLPEMSEEEVDPVLPRR